eukprot:4504159-Amphidinium_carterae.3
MDLHRAHMAFLRGRWCHSQCAPQGEHPDTVELGDDMGIVMQLQGLGRESSRKEPVKSFDVSAQSALLLVPVLEDAEK